MSAEIFVVREGSLPRKADGKIESGIMHASSVVIVRVEGLAEHTIYILCDPGWCSRHEEQVICDRIRDLGTEPAAIDYCFLTHKHHDHSCGLMYSAFLAKIPGLKVYSTVMTFNPPFKIESVTGHSKDGRVLYVTTNEGTVAVAGDAIIDLEYLLAMEVYRPNGYGEKEIRETREGMLRIIDGADSVIPGHGKMFKVTEEMRHDLHRKFDEIYRG